MKAQFNDPLLLAGKILTILMQGIMAFAAVVLMVVTPLVIFYRESINAEIVAEHGATAAGFPTMPIVVLLP